MKMKQIKTICPNCGEIAAFEEIVAGRTVVSDIFEFEANPGKGKLLYIEHEEDFNQERWYQCKLCSGTLDESTVNSRESFLKWIKENKRDNRKGILLD
jgi:hypothetical protein